MIGDVFKLLAAVIATLSAGAAFMALSDHPSPMAIVASVMGIVGGLCWVIAAIAVLIERRRGR
jgi:hypothetical protein